MKNRYSNRRYDALREYLNSLSTTEQHRFAKRCGTSVSYLRKVMSTNQNLGARIVIGIERATDGKIRSDRLRRDIDFAYLRASSGA